jgi:hypothetical protein
MTNYIDDFHQKKHRQPDNPDPDDWKGFHELDSDKPFILGLIVGASCVGLLWFVFDLIIAL